MHSHIFEIAHEISIAQACPWGWYALDGTKTYEYNRTTERGAQKPEE
jgi:hypothetical protein